MINGNRILSVFQACWLLAYAFQPLMGAETNIQGETPPYASYYDAKVGFKPAQRDLTKIYLQLAGSLEAHGTPEPWIRHVLKEHQRISSGYSAATGNPLNSRPSYLTDQYVETMISNWRKLTPGLALEPLCRDSGRNMRYSIMGSWNMAPDELAAGETALSAEEKKLYSSLVSKSYFEKEDFKRIDLFYSTIWDRLSNTGKSQISKRTRRGTLPVDARDTEIQNDKGGTLLVKIVVAHQTALEKYLTTDSSEKVNAESLRSELWKNLKLGNASVLPADMKEYEKDALLYSLKMKADFDSRFEHIRKNSKTPEAAKSMENELRSMVRDLTVLANLEFWDALVDR